MAVAGIEMRVGRGCLAGHSGLCGGDEVGSKCVLLRHRLGPHPPREQFRQEPGQSEGIEVFNHVRIERLPLLRFHTEQRGGFISDCRDVREVADDGRGNCRLVLRIRLVAADIEAVVEGCWHDGEARQQPLRRPVNPSPSRHAADCGHQRWMPGRRPTREEVFRFLASTPDRKILERVAGKENRDPLVTHAAVGP